MDRQIITVDIAPGSNAQQRLMVSQGDIGRPLGVRVIQNGAPLDCSDYSAFLYVLKPDHNYYECTCTVEDDSLICWETAEQETPVAGECLAAIRIMDQDTDIGTATFVEFVEASPADLGYASESLVSSMTEFVDAAQRAAEDATQAVADVDNVNDVAVDASGHIVLTKVLGSTVESDETVLQPADIENDLLATTAGKVLDALQGKTLKDSIDTISGQITSITTTLGKSLVDRGDTTIASEDDIKSLSAGMYRLSSASTSIFPSAYGILIIAQASIYNTALFIPVNSTTHDVIYRRSWNNSNNTWYESGWVANVTTGTITKAVSSGTMDCATLRKVGDTVFASGRIHSLSDVPTNQTFFQIPDGFRPKEQLYVNGFATITYGGTTYYGMSIFVLISPSGAVSATYSQTATLSQIFFAGSWSVL